MCIAKALELFMDRIIKAVADETKARGARRVTPSHLYVPLFYAFSWFGYHWTPQSKAESYHVSAADVMFICAETAIDSSSPSKWGISCR
jgi:hypothetical protein